MKFLERVKGITADLIYSVLGLVVMHGVIQFVLYPVLNNDMGAEQFGTVLTLISIISVMGATFGTAANYARMVSFQKNRAVKGDYNRFLLVVVLLAIPVALIGYMMLGDGIVWHGICYFVLMAVTIIRYYADVEFRLNISYKKFFIYYALIAAGYLVGIVLFKFSGFWAMAMIVGETAAVCFVIIKGNIFTRPVFERSECVQDNLKTFLMLSGTELIAVLILNADRFLLKILVGSTAVTVFYTATLIGKMISLISVPLNSVVIGHLARYKGELKKRTFVGICLGSIGLALIINVLCTVASYVFVGIMYRDVYEYAKEYFFIANLGQILYFISNTLTVVLLRFAKEKYQLYINVIYLVAFLVVALPMTYVYGIVGLSWALVIVNVLKILAIMMIGKGKLCRY